MLPTPRAVPTVIFRFDDFELTPERLELRHAGALVDADALVLRLLACLIRNAGQLVTKEELVADVWDGRAVADNAITVSIARLRKTLGRGQRPAVEFIATVYGRGYRFVRKVDAISADPEFAAQEARAGQAAAPFVGRERVLERMQLALTDASAGNGRACLLIGEPGIGKTRAVEAFERAVASQSLRVVWGYCREGGDAPPLWPWLRIVRELIATCSIPDFERALGPVAAEVLALCNEPRAARPREAIGAKPLEMHGNARHRGFDAVLRTITFAAAQAPRVLVLDDLHRADAASLELLGQLLDEIGRTRILVVATLRNAPSVTGSETLLQHVTGHRNCERISLDRLPEEHVATYVRALLDDTDGHLSKAVYAKSEGNPFFMVELSRQLLEAERPDPERLTVRDAALDLIRQRVARLDGEALGVLSAAAVIGRSFELRLLQAITERDPATLMASLDDALASDVVVAAPDSMTGFAFGHELLRAVLYDALPAAQRRRWHVRIAQALEAGMNSGGAVPPSELAYHLYTALPDGDLRKTVHYCCEAANAASEYGNPDVVRYLRQALEALALIDDHSPRFRMRLLMISCAFARGRAHAEYEDLLRELLKLASEVKDGSMLVRAAHMLNPHPGFQPLPGAHAALEQGLRLLQNDEPGMRARGLAGLACTAPECFRDARARELIEQAVPLARLSGSRMALYGTLTRQLYLLGGPAHADAAREIANELEELGQAHPRRLPILPVNLALHRAVMALQAGDSPAMNEALATADTQARKLFHMELIWHFERLRVVLEINRAAGADALAELERLHREAERRAISANEPFCAFDRCVIFAEFGRPLALDDRLQRSLAYSAGDPPSIWALKVRALATAGQLDEAREALRNVTSAELALLPCDRDYLGTLGHLARAALLLGALDYASVLYRLLAPYPEAFAGHLDFFCEGSVAQLLGMLAQALGEHDAALAHFEAGLRSNERAGLGLRSDEARTQLSQARAKLHSARSR
jgi:DNA-binding winged helix-turn-helix (wHTH) protein